MEATPKLPPATTTTTHEQPHVVVCSSAGMGHLTPFLSLASALSSTPYHCQVTLVIVVPLITSAESDTISSFFSSHPHIHRLDFHVDNDDTPLNNNANIDPFFSRYESISWWAHRLTTRLSTLSPQLSAAFSDFLFTEGLNTTLPHLPNPFPNYTVTTTSARFFSLMAYLPHLLEAKTPPGRPVEIPGIAPFPPENIPPPFFNPTHFFTAFTASNSRHLPLSKGILVNTFTSFEQETLSALASGIPITLPPIFPIGPLHNNSPDTSKHNDYEELLSWLDEQPEKSVMYVSFGNRTALSRDQIRELGAGLERSGCKFLWVMKTSKIDKEDKEERPNDVLGEELGERVSVKGKVVMRWVNQKEILGHRAVGGFVSHCGWNSVVEAAQHGVPILAWPQHGDQRENAGVVEKAGLGVWERGWGDNKVVGAAEIADKVEVVMGRDELRKTAMRIREEAKRAHQVGGSSTAALMTVIRNQAS